MKKEDVLSVAHALSAMKECADRLEIAIRRKDNESIMSLKKEILSLKSQIDILIK